MHQTVNHSTFVIETVDHAIKIARIVMLVASPDRPRQQVRELNQTGRDRIYEQGNFGKIAKRFPSCAVFSKAP